MNEDLYKLDELIEILENIRDNGEGTLNPPKVVLTLAMEIRELQEENKRIEEKAGKMLIDVIKRLIDFKPTSQELFLILIQKQG